MIYRSFHNQINKLAKEREMIRWKFDVNSYFRMKKMREMAMKLGTNVTFYDDAMKRIRDRWPNVKNWD